MAKRKISNNSIESVYSNFMKLHPFLTEDILFEEYRYWTKQVQNPRLYNDQQQRDSIGRVILLLQLHMELLVLLKSSSVVEKKKKAKR